MSNQDRVRIPSVPIRHKKTHIILYVDLRFNIDDKSMFVAKLQSDNLWWLVPRSTLDDSTTQDIGPFDTWEDGIMFAKLRGEEPQWTTS